MLLARNTFRLKRLLQENPVEAPVVAIKTTHGLTTLQRHNKGSVKWVLKSVATIQT